MHLRSILVSLPLLSSTILAAPLAATATIPVYGSAPSHSQVPDNSAKILSDLSAVSKLVHQFNKTLAQIPTNIGIPPGKLIKLQDTSNDIVTALNDTVHDTQASGPASVANAKKVFAAVKLLETATFELLDNLVAHHYGIEKDGFVTVAHTDLIDQRNLVHQLGKALVAIAPEPYKSEAPPIQKAFREHFMAAILAYKH